MQAWAVKFWSASYAKKARWVRGLTVVVFFHAVGWRDCVRSEGGARARHAYLCQPRKHVGADGD